MSSPFDTPQYSEPLAGRRRLRLRKVGILSCGVFGAAAGALMGLLAGGALFMISMLGIGVANANAQQLGPLAGAGFAMVVILPIFYGITGFIGGMINAVVYNVVAGMSGGIEMEFSEVDLLS